MSTDQLICPVLSSHLQIYIYIFHWLKVLCSPQLGLVANGAQLRKRSGFFRPMLLPSISSPPHYSLSFLGLLLRQKEIRGHESFISLVLIWHNFLRTMAGDQKIMVLLVMSLFMGTTKIFQSFLPGIYISLLTAYISLHSMGIEQYISILFVTMSYH